VIALVALLAAAVPDADVQHEYDRITAIRRGGRLEEAARQYEGLAERYPKSRLASRALASAGAIWRWDLEQLDRARALFDRVIDGPDEVPGVMPSVVERLGIEREEAGARAELDLATRLYHAHSNASFAPYLLMRASDILADDLGQTARALEPLVRIRESFPRSTRADEALMKEAGLLRKLHRPKEALKRYQALLRTEKTSFIVGDYNSTKLDDAYYQRAETLRIDLGDDKAALSAYLELVDDLPNSRLVDDALYRAEGLASKMGDVSRAAKLHEKLIAMRPASRYLKR
jgi:TolA-binding protein